MDYSYAASKEVYKSAGEEVGTTDLQYKSFGFFGPTKTITVPLKLTQDVTYYKNAINDADSQIIYDGTTTSAWKLLFSKDTTLKYTTRNYSQDVTGTVDISFGKILKDNILIYLSAIAIIAIIVTLIILIKNMLSSSRRSRSRYGRRRY